MPLSFPSSPTNGQIATVNGRDYQYNGSAWQLVNYTLPVASTSNVGGVKIVDGGGINVSASGDINSVGAQLYLWANFR